MPPFPPRQSGDEWWSIMLFFVFNIFDTVGRYAPGYLKLFSPGTLWVRLRIPAFTFNGAVSNLSLHVPTPVPASN